MSAETKLMAEVMGRMRNSMNGAVTGKMEELGMHYGLNYGVAVHTIRGIASDYAPNHPLARLLWRQDVRELRIAAPYIADPEQIEEELDFWAAGVATTELAEHLGMVLGRNGKAALAMDRWGGGENPLLIYVAAMACIRDVGDTIRAAELAAKALARPESYLSRAGELLSERCPPGSLPPHGQGGSLRRHRSGGL